MKINFFKKELDSDLIDLIPKYDTAILKTQLLLIQIIRLLKAIEKKIK